MSDDLRDFFSEISKSKKEKKEKLEEAKEELNSIVGDLGLDSLFQEFGKIKKEEVVKKKKQEKKLEAFENFFSSIDERKEESIIEIEEVIEKPKEVIEEIIEEQEEIIEEQEEIVEEPVVKEEIVAEEEIEDEKFEEEVEEVLEDVSLIEKSLGLLASVDNNEDPLTPVDKKFATMEDFQKHYGLLIQRIQQQLSTIGGGGAVNIRDLDDIDLSTAQVNNKFLKYNSASGKWVGSDTSGGGYTLPIAAADTLGGIKIGSGLSIDGDGVVTASGGGGGGSIAGIDTSNTSTFNNVDVTGITTIGNVVVGGATTDLIVDGDARVTGILTIGTGSITLDPNAKTITGIDEIEIGTGDERIKLKKSSRGTIDFVDKDNKSIGGIGTEAVFNTTGIMTATKFRTIGGTATQFLKADGTVDTNTYLTSTHAASGVTAIKVGQWDTAYGWGDHSSGGYSASSHKHDSSYAGSSHNHDSSYAASSHNHDSSYAAPNANTTGTAGGLSGTPSITVEDVTLTGEIDLPSNKAIKLGDSDEFQIIRGTNSVIKETGSNGLALQTNGPAIYLWDTDNDVGMGIFNTGAAVELKYASTTRFATTNEGVLVSGIASITNRIDIKSDDGTSGRIHFYCESNNAHYLNLQAPPHADFGGNLDVLLPSSAGTLLLDNGSGVSLTGIVTSIVAGDNVTLTGGPTGIVTVGVTTEQVQDIVGAMFSGNTETNITATYQDDDGTIDLVASGGGGGGSQNLFSTIAVSGQNDVVADATTDTLTFAAGANVTITTDDSTDTVTIAASGGGGGGSTDMLEVMLFT